MDATNTSAGICHRLEGAETLAMAVDARRTSPLELHATLIMCMMIAIGTHSGKGSVMRTNIVLDDRLIQQAMRATGLKTKRATVEAGLKLLLQVKAQAGIRRLRGKVVWEGDLREMRTSRVAS